MTENTRIISSMIDYYKKDPRRINHFMKVFGYASLICEMEALDHATRRIVEVTAIVHDIGIKNSEAKYGNASGHYQQIEGPPVARELLGELGIEDEVIERCCWLIAHHHTYKDIKDMDYQILVEADFLVNAYEDQMSEVSLVSVRDKIFRTKSGIELLEKLFL